MEYKDLADVNKYVVDAREKRHRAISRWTELSDVPSDLVEATAWFRAALVTAETGHASSQYQLGCAYERGMGTREDRAEAIRWYRKAAHEGHDRSRFRLGFLLLVQDEFAESRQWFERAARGGHPYAEEFAALARALATPSNVKDEAHDQLWDRALPWFVETSDGGDREAAFWLGSYLDEFNLPTEYLAQFGPERATAAYWSRRAAELGDPHGALRLADLPRTGMDADESAREAFAWNRRAVTLSRYSDDFVDQMFEVGLALLYGRGVRQDEAQALGWLQRAVDAAKRSQLSFTAEMLDVGLAFLLGRGVRQDDNHGLNWLQKAADAGSREARETIDRLRALS